MTGTARIVPAYSGRPCEVFIDGKSSGTFANASRAVEFVAAKGFISWTFDWLDGSTTVVNMDAGVVAQEGEREH